MLHETIMGTVRKLIEVDGGVGMKHGGLISFRLLDKTKYWMG